MPVDLGVILLSSLIGIGGTIVAGLVSNTSRPSDPVVNARNTLDRIRTILDQLERDLNGMREENEHGLYCFDDSAPEYKVRGPSDLETAWKELKDDYNAYIERIPEITTKQAATVRVIFSSDKKSIRDFCDAVDALLFKTDQLNTDCSKSSTAFKKARNQHRSNNERVIDLRIDYGPRPRTPTSAGFPPSDLPLNMRF
ncbi:hypothetical protein BDY19DRAFT_179402 [Irpex rosettiformis]|uniref:Uncharacterized protein n=1 Tax=Irpex rosettiformis TaxID=378272 RepID=A0ACB8U3V8_9APHY|nr:hypothetical protein BDY19DRAFT_179402 [Irpex rosettiformis]